MLALTSCMAVFSLMLFPFCPESPRWLFISQNKREEAIQGGYAFDIPSFVCYFFWSTAVAQKHRGITLCAHLLSGVVVCCENTGCI